LSQFGCWRIGVVAGSEMAGKWLDAGEKLRAEGARLRKVLAEREAEVADIRAQLAALEAEVGGEKHILEAEVGDEKEDESPVAAAGLEAAEAHLAEVTQAAQNPAVLQLLSTLQAAAVYTDSSNHETNQKLWDAYARDWGPDRDWVKRMAGHLPGGTCPLTCIGDEWSDEASLSAALNDWIVPHLGSDVQVAEIGSGGGRVAARVAGKVRKLVCFDLSAEMLKRAKKHLETLGVANAEFEQVDGSAAYPQEYDGQFDFVYSFDVFVHMDLHQMYKSLRAMHRLLRPGGSCFVSFANLLAPDGWRRFARQQRFTVGGFYFVSPDIVRCLLEHAGLVISKVSTFESDNTYLRRDLLVLARRPSKD